MTFCEFCQTLTDSPCRSFVERDGCELYDEFMLDEFYDDDEDDWWWDD